MTKTTLQKAKEEIEGILKPHQQDLDEVEKLVKEYETGNEDHVRESWDSEEEMYEHRHGIEKTVNALTDALKILEKLEKEEV